MSAPTHEFQDEVSKAIIGLATANREASRRIAMATLLDLLGRAATREKSQLSGTLPREVQEEFLNDFLAVEWDQIGQLIWAEQLAEFDRPGHVVLDRMRQFRRSFARRATKVNSSEEERAEQLLMRSINDKLRRVVQGSSRLQTDRNGFVVRTTDDPVDGPRPLPDPPSRENDGQIRHASDKEYEAWTNHRIAHLEPARLSTLAQELFNAFALELHPLNARRETHPIVLIHAKRVLKIVEEIFDEEDQRIVYRRAVQEWTFREIGEEIGTDRENARSRWQRIQRQIQRHVEATGAQ